MPSKIHAARSIHRHHYRVTSTVLLNAGVGVFFSVAFFVVFLPQHFECYRRKSTEGLSPWLLLFGGISFMFAFYNVLLMDIGTLGACSGSDSYDYEPEPYNCIAAFCPILQQALPAISGYPTWYIWYHLYGPETLRTQHLISLSLFLLAASCGFGISLYVLHYGDQKLQHTVGTAWGIIATFFNFIMWFPQIETTVALRSRGALSVSMLISTVISDILFTLYLTILAHQHWSVWLPQVPDAFQQILLLSLLWYFGELWTDSELKTPLLRAAQSAKEMVQPVKGLGEGGDVDGSNGASSYQNARNGHHAKVIDVEVMPPPMERAS